MSVPSSRQRPSRQPSHVPRRSRRWALQARALVWTAAALACASVVRRLLDPRHPGADASQDTGATWTAGRGTEHTPRPWRSGGAPNEVMVMAAMCNGCLVLHRDGEIAYCSEELDGKACLGYDAPHLAGVMACRVTPRGTRCRHCDEVMRRRLILAPDFVPDGLWAVAN